MRHFLFIHGLWWKLKEFTLTQTMNVILARIFFFQSRSTQMKAHMKVVERCTYQLGDFDWVPLSFSRISRVQSWDRFWNHFIYLRRLRLFPCVFILSMEYEVSATSEISFVFNFNWAISCALESGCLSMFLLDLRYLFMCPQISGQIHISNK